MENYKVKVPDHIKELVRAVLEKSNPSTVAKRWSMNRDTLARAMAGYEINSGTLAEIKLGLLKERGIEIP